MKLITIKECLECKKIFEIIGNDKVKLNRKYCSRICSNKNYAKRRTDEEIKSMSERMKGENNPFFGKKHNKELQEKISKSNLKTRKENALTTNLSENDHSFITGILLADGSLEKQHVGGFTSRITYGCKFKETLEKIIDELKSIKFGEIFFYTSKPHIKSKKCYHAYFLKSKYYATLLSLRDKWYPEGKKVVPKDIHLDLISCYWWFIGDGFVTQKCVHFSTDCFTTEDNLFLVEKLKGLGFSTTQLDTNNRIVMRVKDSLNFMNWIHKKDYLTVYDYKWEKLNIL